MKKSVLVICSVFLIIMLCACSKPIEKLDGNGMANPVNNSSLEELAQELKIEPFELGDVQRVTRIDGENPIFSIEVLREGLTYDVRLAKAVDGENDISGVYLNEELVKIVAAIYDSADVNEAPSISVEGDSEYTKSYGEWKGYSFSVSINQKIKSDDMQKITLLFINSILG